MKPVKSWIVIDVLLVASRVQRRAGRRTFLLKFKHFFYIALLVIQTPETVIVVIQIPLLSGATPPSGHHVALRGAPDLLLLLLDLGAVQDVHSVGRQGELHAV